MNYYDTPITNNEEAKQYICNLYFNGDLYHLDEYASSIIHFATGERAFTDEQAKILDKRRDEVFKHMKVDPHQLCCSLSDIQL